jgi:hypothetical protein
MRASFGYQIQIFWKEHSLKVKPIQSYIVPVVLHECLSLQGKNTRGCLRTGRWEEFLHLRERKYEEDESRLDTAELNKLYSAPDIITVI